jgi:uncharacterized protein
MQIDRLSPAERPRRRAVMRQNWRNLLFLHWPIRPDCMRALIPPQLDLDLFEDTAYVGLVPFTMTGVRPVGLPAVWGLSSFHETNLRTYVRLGNRDPGVWFFSLDAANSIAVRLARKFFHLPYHYARMFMEFDSGATEDASATILYAGVRRWPGPLPASYAIRAAALGPARPARPGTLEHFLIERYVLYAAANGRLNRGRVHHAPYSVQSARVLSLNENLLSAASLEHTGISPLAHFATGVDVEVFALEKIDQALLQ